MINYTFGMHLLWLYLSLFAIPLQQPHQSKKTHPVYLTSLFDTTLITHQSKKTHPVYLTYNNFYHRIFYPMITAFKDIGKIIEESRQEYGDQVLQLDFSSVKIFRFTQKTKTLVESKCKHLTVLKLIQCELNSLQKLPDLDITAIDVSINKLKDADLQPLTKFKNLSILNVGDNFISGLQAIAILKNCTKLKDLEMSGNEIQKLPNYRTLVFQELKHLDYLDKLDKNGLPQPSVDSHSDDVISDVQDEDQDGQYYDEDSSDGQFQDQEDFSSSSEDQERIKKYRKAYHSEGDSP